VLELLIEHPPVLRPDQHPQIGPDQRARGIEALGVHAIPLLLRLARDAPGRVVPARVLVPGRGHVELVQPLVRPGVGVDAESAIRRQVGRSLGVERSLLRPTGGVLIGARRWDGAAIVLLFAIGIGVVAIVLLLPASVVLVTAAAMTARSSAAAAALAWLVAAAGGDSAVSCRLKARGRRRRCTVHDHEVKMRKRMEMEIERGRGLG